MKKEGKMKAGMIKTIPLAAALVVGLAGTAHAADFWDTFATNVTTVGATSTIAVTMNSADISVSWNDLNSDGAFDAGENVLGALAIYGRNGALALQSPANLTRAQLEAWAEANANAIFEALFPAGISEITGATDDNMLASATVGNNLFKKATVARKSQEEGKDKNQEVRAEVEYLDLKVDEENGSAYSLILGYSNEGESGRDFSVTVPYRYSTMKDDINSESHFVGLDLSLKYPVAKWGKSELNLGGAIFGSAYYLETDTIEESGNLKYGGGLFTSINTDLGFGTLGAGVDYKVAKAYLPSGMNSDNIFLEKAIDYVNDLDPVHTISYGFNFGLPVGEAAAVNLEVIRASFVSSDVPDGQKNRTTVALSGTYFPSDTFELNLGVRSDFELEDVDTYGVMLGVVHRF